jgi:hypothetical protein
MRIIENVAVPLVLLFVFLAGLWWLVSIVRKSNRTYSDETLPISLQLSREQLAESHEAMKLQTEAIAATREAIAVTRELIAASARSTKCQAAWPYVAFGASLRATVELLAAETMAKLKAGQLKAF